MKSWLQMRLAIVWHDINSCFGAWTAQVRSLFSLNVSYWIWPLILINKKVKETSLIAGFQYNKQGRKAKRERLYLWPAEEKNTENLKKKSCLHDFTACGALGAFPEFIIKGDSSHRNCSRERKPCQISAVWMRSFAEAFSRDWSRESDGLHYKTTEVPSFH